MLLGIDIGGTTVKFGALDESGCVLASSAFPTSDLAQRARQQAFARTVAQSLAPQPSAARSPEPLTIKAASG